MPISRLLRLLIVMCVLVPAQAGAGPLTFRSTDDALKQGISAYNGGYYELALPALDSVKPNPEAAAADDDGIDRDAVTARFYTALIYADNDGAYTDHAKAYTLFRQLEVALRNVDPGENEIAAMAARTLTELSRYQRRGITAIKLEPNPSIANRSLWRAAINFNNEDAQFELAKVLLRSGDDNVRETEMERRIKNGVHWLSQLSRAGHAPAQAFLADLLWRGKYVKRDQSAALNLIDVAVANAPPQERVWIEDIYQAIFCNAGEGMRAQATGRVADWRSRYGRRYTARSDYSGLSDLSASPTRTCSNGEVVRPIDVVPFTEPEPLQVMRDGDAAGPNDGNRPASHGSTIISIPAIGFGFSSNPPQVYKQPDSGFSIPSFGLSD